VSTKPNPSGPLPLPEGVKLRTRKFGTNPTSALVPVPVGNGTGDSSAPREEFGLDWEDPALGLTLRVRERDNGHLIAEVFSTDPARLNKAAVSVGLVGTVENGQLRKTIALTVAEENGCSGSADFGPLSAAVKELGPQIGVVAFLVV
jgi:hypothetical protein